MSYHKLNYLADVTIAEQAGGHRLRVSRIRLMLLIRLQLDTTTMFYHKLNYLADIGFIPPGKGAPKIDALPPADKVCEAQNPA